MSKQSYYLGESIQREVKCATIGFVLLQSSCALNLFKKQMHHTSTEWVL